MTIAPGAGQKGNLATGDERLVLPTEPTGARNGGSARRKAELRLEAVGFHRGDFAELSAKAKRAETSFFIDLLPPAFDMPPRDGDFDGRFTDA